MRRNELITLVGKRIDTLITTPENISNRQEKINALVLFSNDLCTAPTDRNRKLGAVCYTMKEAVRKWRLLS
jgi:hypothetical protein